MRTTGPDPLPPDDRFDELFTNRNEELDRFRQDIEASPNEIVPIRVYEGVTGSGKTWLRRQFEAIAREKGVPTVHVELDKEKGGNPLPSPDEIVMRLVDAMHLDAPRTRLALLYLAMEEYGQVDASGVRREFAANVVGSGLDAFLSNLHNLSFGGIAAAFAKGRIEAWQRSKQSLSMYLNTDEGKADRARLALQASDPVAIRQDLFRRLGLDLDAAEPTRTTHSIQAVVLVDSLEQADLDKGPGKPGPLDWIISLYENCFNRVRRAPTVAVVCFGQNPGHFEPDEMIAEHRLDGFTKSYADELLGKQKLPAIYHEAALAAAREGADRYHALRIGLLCDTYHELFARGKTMKPQDLAADGKDVDEIAGRFVSLLSREEAERMKRLAVTPTWDRDAFASCFHIDPSDGDKLNVAWKRISAFSFVQPVGGEYFTLHSVMRKCLQVRLDDDEIRERNEFWREHWSSRQTTGADEFAARAWTHWYAADRVGAVSWWNEAAETARAGADGVTHGLLCLFPLRCDWESAGTPPEDLISWSFELAHCQLGDSKEFAAKSRSMAQIAAESTPRRSNQGQWALAQNNLGSVLQVLGERTNDEAVLREAVSAYRAALEVYTKESLPADWAMTQNNLGIVLQVLGERTNDEAVLQEAVSAYRAALQVRTKESLPADWAMTQNNLGTALRSLGRLLKSSELIRQALEAYEEAASILLEIPGYASTVRRNLDRCKADMDAI